MKFTSREKRKKNLKEQRLSLTSNRLVRKTKKKEKS